MTTKYVPKKALGYTLARFVVGCIAPSNQLTHRVNSELVTATEREIGEVEEILPVQSFPDAPESYVGEMGDNLSTTVMILRGREAYTHLHQLKGKSLRVEEQLITQGKRTFNLNPGAVGTFGLALASHKDTGGRRSASTYAFGLHPHLFFGRFFGGNEVFYERVMRWTGDSLESLDRITEGDLFPEYREAGRVAKFEELVRTLPRNERSIELLADMAA